MAKLVIGDPVPADATQVGPIPVGLLTGESGRIQQDSTPLTYRLSPLTAASITAFKADMLARGLKVADAVDGAPYDFGKAGFPVSLWVMKSHPDITIVRMATISWFWSKSCIIPTPDATTTGGASIPIIITMKYGTPGTVGGGSQTGSFGAGGTWSASIGPSGFSLTATPPGGLSTQSASSGPPTWHLNTTSGSPTHGYYVLDGSSLALYAVFNWTVPPYPDPVGISCAETYNMTVFIPSS